MSQGFSFSFLLQRKIQHIKHEWLLCMHHRTKAARDIIVLFIERWVNPGA